MLKSSRLVLRSLRQDDINSTYLAWMNDPAVNCFLETRFVPQSIESIQAYWHEHRDDLNSPWFAMEIIDNGPHIGNIKLGPINWLHRRADISLFIGNRDFWGKGFATESILLISQWAFHELDLQKLTAGVYSGNVGSRRAFEKAGFELEATLKDEVFFRGKRVDAWRMGLLRKNWNQSFLSNSQNGA
jgi:ribosomal-protein-alanine N-acetyltransferase